MMETTRTKLFFSSVLTISVFMLFVSYEVYHTITTPEHLIPDSMSHSLHNYTKDGLLCKNKDFSPQHKKAVWTFLTYDANYILSTLKIGHALRLYTTTEQFDMVVMELASKPLGSTAWRCLEEIGWKRCVVDRIKPLDEVGTQKMFPRFVDVLTKLQLWGMTMYQTLVFLDADTLVLHSISHLLQQKLKNQTIAATAQIWHGEFQGVNTGVFVIHPSSNEYERLLRLQQDPSVIYDTGYADQGFLNVVYKDKWVDIGFINNALVYTSWQNHEYWLRHYEVINIIHFTGAKPWACSPDNLSFIEWLTTPSHYYTEICKVWSEMPPHTCANLV
jgi:glycogenin glucosyltransferase